MSLSTLKPRRRLSQNTSPTVAVQESLLEALHFGGEADSGAKRKVYLITLPHPRRSHTNAGERLVHMEVPPIYTATPYI